MPTPAPRLLAILALLATAPALRAQGIDAGCDRVATTSIRFGLAGGDLMPASVELTAAGAVRRRSMEGAGAVLGHVPRDTVTSLARRAWFGGFAALPPAPTVPPKNPDAARRFIELHSACGAKHVEYAPGTESPIFRDFYARLQKLTAPMTRARSRTPAARRPAR